MPSQAAQAFYKPLVEKLKEKYTGVVAKVVDALLKAIVHQFIFHSTCVLSVYVGKDFLPEFGRRLHLAASQLAARHFGGKVREFSDTLRALQIEVSEVTYIIGTGGAQ